MSSTPASDARADDRLRTCPSRGLRGELYIPGDKSLSHRALIIGALAKGETRIDGLLESRDVLRTAAALRAFGIEVDRLGAGSWRVRGGSWRSPTAPVDCGNSGTSARLMMGAAVGQRAIATFTGDASLRRRPMERVTIPLERMGARANPSDRLPIRIETDRVNGISFSSPHASAQVKSAVLLAGLHSDQEVEVIEPAPSRDHTERMLTLFGCDIDSRVTSGGGQIVRLGKERRLRGREVSIAGDPSSAAFLVVAALITPGSDVTIRDVLINPLRSGLLKTLIEMGANIEVKNPRPRSGEEIADLRVCGSRLRGVLVPASRVPSMIDEYPVLAVAAAFASGRTVMEGLEELRAKESDRIATIGDGLRSCGIPCRSEAGTLVVEQAVSVPGGMVRTQGDHRIAMSFLVLGGAAQGSVTVDEGSMIDTSFPGFFETMRRIGANIHDAATGSAGTAPRERPVV